MVRFFAARWRHSAAIRNHGRERAKKRNRKGRVFARQRRAIGEPKYRHCVRRIGRLIGCGVLLLPESGRRRGRQSMNHWLHRREAGEDAPELISHHHAAHLRWAASELMRAKRPLPASSLQLASVCLAWRSILLTSLAGVLARACELLAQPAGRPIRQPRPSRAAPRRSERAVIRRAMKMKW